MTGRRKRCCPWWSEPPRPWNPPMIRISAGLTSITLCALFAAQALGLIPDRQSAVAEGRKALAEPLAVHCALAARRQDVGAMNACLASAVQRNPDITAAAVRDRGGKVLA